LISGRLPEHVRQQIQAGEPLPFSEKPPEVKVLISLREDNLGLLQELTLEIPTILQHRFRLTGLSETDAWQAIIEPAKLGSEVIEFATRPFEYTETTVKEMIAATRTKEGSIDPFFLQILCSHVEKQIPRKQNPGTSLIQVDPSYLGGEKGIQAITRKFYLDAIRRLPRGKFRRRARRLCEEGLLTADGHRRSVLEEDLEQFKLRPEALETLEALRLLRKEPRHGSFYYEISHDRLAEAIREVREERRGLSRKVKISFAMLTISLLLITIYLTGRLRTENLEKKVFVTLYNGGMQRAQGDPQAALSTYQKGVEIAEKPAVHIPANIERQRLLSITYDRIGKVQRAQGDLQAALSAYQKGLEIREQLAARYPDNVQWQTDLAVSLRKIATVFEQQEPPRKRDAAANYQKALDILRPLAAENRLTAAHKGWIDIIEKRLETLKE
jgi:tetratricopeptide (TPR) repeat protein